MSDYLFDKQGEPDGELERLESLLAPLAYRPAPLALPSLPAPRRRRAPLWTAGGLVAAAALIALVVWRPWRPSLTGWPATVGGVATRLPVGEWLETGAGRARLRVAELGAVELGPGTRARIVATGAVERMQLARGSLAAVIDAPPRRFVVETPHALVTDLGCAFTLDVDAAGDGRLVVTAGQVALSAGGREVVVPAGQECALDARGPGTPHFTGTSVTPPPPPASLSPPPSPSPSRESAPSLRSPSPSPAPSPRSPSPEKSAQATKHGKKKTAGNPPVPSRAPATTNVDMKNTATKNAVTKKPVAKDPAKLDHDALKGLERSIQ